MQENELVNRLKKGDEEAFRIIFNDNQKKVINACYRLVNDIDIAEDLTQEVFIKVYSSISQFRGESQLSTWIYRIAINVAISFYRKNSVRNNMTTQLTSAVNFIDDSHTKELEDDIALLYRFIHELNSLDKALMLFYLEQKTYKEIADILDISETNVATRIGRVKKVIKQKFLAINK